MSGRPTVVQFGAGAIGRGFLGQLWTEAGFEVVYIDVSPPLIEALNTREGYPLRLADNDGVSDLWIAAVRALPAADTGAVAREIVDCAFVCTAVGANVFTKLAPVIASGIEQRTKTGGLVLNVLCCENENRASERLRAAVQAALPDDPCLFAYADERTGFVDASVGRMVPPPTPELLAEDSLLILSEPYKELPIDGTAWRGPIPGIPGLLPKANFPGYVARKLFTHNGAHALLAYHGFQRGCEYIWQALEDPFIHTELLGYWQETGDALIAAFGFDPEEQRAHEADLLRRFANRALGDTVARVGRDPKRKLRGDDRLFGAGRLCLQIKPDTIPVHVCRAIAAALRFDAPGDPTAAEVRAAVETLGAAAALATLSGLATGDPLIQAAVAG